MKARTALTTIFGMVALIGMCFLMGIDGKYDILTPVELMIQIAIGLVMLYIGGLGVWFTRVGR